MSDDRWPLSFLKYSAAGNDFILLDAREDELAGDPAALAQALCRRGRSVGADGLIVVEESDEDGSLARMRLWNADGSQAEISGNGARCVARFLVDDGSAPSDGEVTFSTDVGVVAAHVDGDICRLRLPMTARVEPARRLRVEGRDITGTYVEVGVPFFVCFHDNPDELPVRFLGRAIRNHPELAPRGANVDFVRVDDEQHLFFRVYERGVEDETLSSGTGSVSAALAAAAAGKVHSPVLCATRGTELTVRFTPAPEGPSDDDAAAADVAGEMAAPEVGDGGGAADDASGGARFGNLEIEGDAMPIYRGEALVQASRPPRRK